MASHTLPLIADPAHLRKQAKTRLAALKAQNPSAKLIEAQALLAREYGFANWTMLLEEAQRRAVPLPRSRRTAMGLRDLERWRFDNRETVLDARPLFFRTGLAAQIAFIVAALAGVAMVMLAGRAAAAEALPPDSYVGVYRVTPRLVAHITQDGDHLFIRLTGQPARALEAKASDDFMVAGVPAEISFTRDANSVVSSLSVHQAGHDITAPRITDAEAQAIEALPPPPKGHPMARTWPMLGIAAPRILTSQTGALDYWPCLSPDGKAVLFSRSADGGKTWSLLRVAVTGGAPSPLPLPPGLSATRADWGKNGRIAFTMTDAQGRNSVWTANGDGSHAAALPGSDGLIYPSWSSDGLVAMDTAHLLVARLDLQGHVARLTDPAQLMTGMPSASPDGKWVVFAGQKNAGQPYNQEENTLWLTPMDGAPVSLETPPLQGRAPVFSPDGKIIAFESDRGSPDGHYAVFLIHRDGSGLTQVTDYALNATHPVFSRDGRHLVIATGDPAQQVSNIAIVDLP